MRPSFQGYLCGECLRNKRRLNHFFALRVLLFLKEVSQGRRFLPQGLKLAVSSRFQTLIFSSLPPRGNDTFVRVPELLFKFLRREIFYAQPLIFKS